MATSIKNPRRSKLKKTLTSHSEQPIRVELDAAQVNHVIHAAAGSGPVSLQLSSVPAGRWEGLSRGYNGSSKKLSRSLILGLLTYAAFPEDGSYIRVTDIAWELHMRSSTAHRYISTLLGVGLIERDPRKRLYRLTR